MDKEAIGLLLKFLPDFIKFLQIVCPTIRGDQVLDHQLFNQVRKLYAELYGLSNGLLHVFRSRDYEAFTQDDFKEAVVTLKYL